MEPSVLTTTTLIYCLFYYQSLEKPLLIKCFNYLKVIIIYINYIVVYIRLHSFTQNKITQNCFSLKSRR